MATGFVSFALCIDCWEMGVAPTYQDGSNAAHGQSWNHDGHAVHIFGAPNDYPSSLEKPIRQVLLDLQRGTPISDGRMEMFSLCCAMTAIQPNNGVKVQGADVPLGAVQLYADKKANDETLAKRRAPEPEPANSLF